MNDPVPPQLRWALQITGLSPTEKIVLILIAFMLGDDERCTATQQEIAEAACLHRRSVIRAILTLKKKGLLTVQPVEDERHLKMPNIYRLPNLLARYPRMFVGASRDKNSPQTPHANAGQEQPSI